MIRHSPTLIDIEALQLMRLLYTHRNYSFHSDIFLPVFILQNVDKSRRNDDKSIRNDYKSPRMNDKSPEYNDYKSPEQMMKEVQGLITVRHPYNIMDQ